MNPTNIIEPMNQFYITGIIIALIILLCCYAFVSQTIEKKRKQKQRLLTAFKQRAASFKFMISGFPPEFLTKDLLVLVYRSLVDVLEQLATLEPENAKHMDELKHFSDQLEEANRTGKAHKRVKFTSPQQIKEVKHHLEELHKFLLYLLRKGTINQPQMNHYAAQIRQLVLQITVDSYLMNAKQAQKVEKLRLAIHYYQLAKKLLDRENSNKQYTAQIKQLSGVINELENQANIKQTPQTAQEGEGSEEWDQFAEPEDDWKKKNVYD